LNEHHIIYAIVTLVGLGVAAQWTAWRLKLPAIVLLAAVGLLMGPGLGLIDPSEDFGEYLRPVVSICVAIILFEGGLSLQLRELKESATGVSRLVYLGAPLAWAFSSLCAHYVGGLDWPVSLVFGAIMVVTGPTVIMPILRQAALNRRTASYLKWEGIVNDPIGALFAVLVFQFFILQGSGSGWQEVAESLAFAIACGVVFGGLGGWLIARAFHRGMHPEYLKSPVLLGLVLVVYALSELFQQEAGLLSVTVMGIVVGNMNLPGIGDMKRFKEYITIMLVSVVFVSLTADLDVASLGIVAAATAGVMGPRLVDAGYSAEVLLPLVFAIIFATVFAHGLSINWLAARLGLASKNRDSVLIVGASPWTVELAQKLKSADINVLLADTTWHSLRPARLAGIPVFYGDILSEFAEESIELAHVQTVLAATANDAYNALVCTTMAPEIGQKKVFQLAMGSDAEEDPRAMSRPRRGNPAFDAKYDFDMLWRLYVRGWKIFKTRISETYGYDDFVADRPEAFLQIMLLREAGEVEFLRSGDENEFLPRGFDRVVRDGTRRKGDGRR
jgi:NhaP-type Na+/H+ or K+/H+ antiporter